MSASLAVSPAVALIDVPRAITLAGFSPHSRVALTLTSRQADGQVWRSRNVYVADAQGAVDVSRQAPESGAYTGIDALGPIWSQSPTQADDGDASQVPPPEGPAGAIHTLACASDAEGKHAIARFEQHYAADGVVRQEVRDRGLAGVLYTPAAPGPHPAIVVLNGSGGGINEARAALYASHGYAALALGYFGAPGLPDHLSGIPLEYFDQALQWLRGAVQPAGGFVAVSGHSRGGELALLLGSLYPQAVSAVIAYVPSSVVHGVLNAGKPGEGRFKPAWTHGGKPVPHVWEHNAAQDWSLVDTLPEPRRQAQAFVQAHRDAAAVARARIPVERIAGPVLLLSAGDDGYWPSSQYAREVAQALKAADHPHAVEHLDYPHAGHALHVPVVPTTELSRAHAVSGIVLTGGGDAAANARANIDSWAAVRRFLRAAAAQRGPAAA
ncbi:hypothetical protein D3C85_344440 [compost metagenome]